MTEHQNVSKPCDASSESDTPKQSLCPADGPHDTSTPTSESSLSPLTRTAASTSQESPTTPNLRRPRDLPIDAIVIDDPKNSRLQTDPDHVARLAGEIAANGLLHPVTVTIIDGQPHLVAGNNRLLAAKSLGWHTISATTIPNDPLTVAMVRLAENLHRQNLTPIEEACQLADLVQTHPEAVDGAAKLTNRSIDWILGRLDLLDWPPQLQEALHAGRVSIAAGRILNKIEPPDLRDRYIRNATEHGCSAATATLWLQQAQSTPPSDFELTNFIANSPQKTQTSPPGVICKICERELPPAHIVVLHVCQACHYELCKSIDEPCKPITQQPPGITITKEQLAEMINQGVEQVLSTAGKAATTQN